MSHRGDAALTLQRPFTRGILLISDSESADLPTYSGTAVVASGSAVVVRVRRPVGGEDEPLHDDADGGAALSTVTVLVRLGPAGRREPLFDGVISVDSGRITVGDTDADDLIEVTPGRWRIQVLPNATEQAGLVEIWVSVPHEPRLASAFLAFAPTVRGQVTGAVLIAAPAIIGPLPLGEGLHGVVQVVAVLLGFLGAAVVFGGLLQRLLQHDAGPGPGPGGRPRTIPLDDLLRTVPHRQVVWPGVAAVAAGLALGALSCSVLVLTRGWAAHLSEVLILGLPATALFWFAGRGFRASRPTGSRRSTDWPPLTESVT